MPVTPEQQADVDALRSEQNLTLRAVSSGMENHLYKIYPVLDHGFIRVIDYMGDDNMSSEDFVEYQINEVGEERYWDEPDGKED